MRRQGAIIQGPVVRPLVPEIALASFLDNEHTVTVSELHAADGDISLTELMCICHLVKRLVPRHIFEIGTYDGRTTLNMARNCPAEAKIFTLDLPRAGLNSTLLPLDPHDRKYINKPRSGKRFRCKEAGKIIQLLGDSARFDYSPFYKKIDLIFIDGSHSYEYTFHDSKTASQLLSARRSAIVWHDYGTVYWEGVTRALNELYAKGGFFSGLKRIQGTSLVYLLKK